MKKSVLVTIVFALALIFSSCENFLKGNDTANDLQKILEYNNAPGCTILLKSDAATGTFLAGDSKEFKVGYAEEIYFSVNKENCIFEGLLVQSLTDAKADMSDYVELKITERDEDKGLYKILVKVVKAAPDLVIRPVTIAYPVIDSYSPAAGSQASYANAPIIITFNTRMEGEDITPENSQFNYKNIFLSCGQDDISPFFEQPVFNADKTILTLTPKADFLPFLESKNEIEITINVDFGNEITVQINQRNIALKQNENSHFTVTYKPMLESIPPAKTGFGFLVSTEQFDFQTLNSMNASQLQQLDSFVCGENLSTKANILDYSQKVIQNRTEGTVYIYGRYYDNDSGVNKVKLEIQKTNLKSGVIINSNINEKIIFFENNNIDDVEYYSDGKTLSYCITYELPNDLTAADNNDGAYLFTVTTYDASNNYSQEFFTAIKDTAIDISGIEVYNVSNDVEINISLPDDRNENAIELINNGTYNDEIKTIKMKFTRQVYGMVGIDGDANLYVEYINKDNELVKEKISPDENDAGLYKHSLNVEHVHDLEIKLIGIDALGKEQQKMFYFPPLFEVNTQEGFIFIPQNAKWTYCHWSDKENNIFIRSTSYSNENNQTKVFFSRYNYCLFENNLLFSEMYTLPDIDNPYNDFKINDSIPVPDNNFNISFGVMEDGSEYSITVTLPQRIWDKGYDYIVGYYNSVSSNRGQQIFYVEKPLLTKTIPTSKVRNFFVGTKKDGYFWLAGLKDGKRSEATTKMHYTLDDEQISDLKNLYQSRTPPSCAGLVFVSQFDDKIERAGYSKAHNYFFVNNSVGIIDSINVITNNAYQKKYYSESFGDLKQNAIIMKDQAGNIYLPMVDWEYGQNEIIVELENTRNPETRTYTVKHSFDVGPCPIIFQKPDINSAQTKITLTSLPTDYQIQSSSKYVYFSHLESDGWKNDEKREITTPVNGIYTIPNVTITSNKYIKAVTVLNYGELTKSLLFFNGIPSSGASTDKLIDMGDYFFVSSDQPVYMCTASTKHSMHECINWTSEKWETMHLIYNERLLDFSPDNFGSIKTYNLDTTPLDDGDCYVVIAHYADGHTVMSNVMEK